jgi:hypothetical protein
MSNPRAVRYRRLALAELDPAKAALLYSLADEADRGLLVTSEWIGTRRTQADRPSSRQRPLVPVATPAEL